MNRFPATPQARYTARVLVGILAALLGFAIGCAHMTVQEAEYELAIDKMHDGYAELGKVVNDLDRNKEGWAKFHFNRAMKDFDEAFEYFAEAELPADQQSAVAELRKGFDKLEKCVKELEKNNIAKAQTYFDEAQGYFAAAAHILD
jgi:hypothetical protein